jgi:hypothetical protein
MYEPYGEEGKLKINLGGWKEKIKEKVSNLKGSKWLLIIIAVVALGSISGYTGWTAYTAKITEAGNQVMILQKQMDACNNNLTSCFFEIDSVKTGLLSSIASKEMCDNDLNNTLTNLDFCNQEKEKTMSDILTKTGDLTTCQNDLEMKTKEYYELKSNTEDLECAFAKRVCGTVGMTYYFVKGNNDIICCIKQDPSYCGETPSSADLINKINC